MCVTRRVSVTRPSVFFTHLKSTEFLNLFEHSFGIKLCVPPSCQLGYLGAVIRGYRLFLKPFCAVFFVLSFGSPRGGCRTTVASHRRLQQCRTQAPCCVNLLCCSARRPRPWYIRYMLSVNGHCPTAAPHCSQLMARFCGSVATVVSFHSVAAVTDGCSVCIGGTVMTLPGDYRYSSNDSGMCWCASAYQVGDHEMQTRPCRSSLSTFFGVPSMRWVSPWQ